MFSIEATIDEIISFIRRFFKTIAFTFVYPLRLLSKPLSTEVLKPSHYLLICMLLFFGIQTLDSWYVHAVSLNKTLKSYIAYYDKSSIETNLLYIIPVAIGLWLLVTLTGRLLRLNTEAARNFKSYLFCWTGNCLLLGCIYIAMTVIIPDISISVNASPNKWLDTIGVTIVVSYYIVWYGPFLIALFAALFSFKKLPTFTAVKFLLLPVLLWASVSICVKGSKVISGFLDEKHDLLALYSPEGDKRLFFLNGSSDTTHRDSIRLDLTLVVRNTSEGDIYFANDMYMTLTAGKELMATGDPTTATFYIQQIDDLPPKSVNILKSSDSKTFLLKSIVSTRDWAIWLTKAHATPGGWSNAQLYIPINSPDLKGVAVNSEIMVDYRLINTRK